jgi:acyl carrier protein
MRIEEIIAEALEIDVNGVDDSFAFKESANWDSLAALTLITGIEDIFRVVIAGTDLERVGSVLDLKALIQTKIK